MCFNTVYIYDYVVCRLDYIIRFGTMALKALVAGCFLIILPSRKKVSLPFHTPV